MSLLYLCLLTTKMSASEGNQNYQKKHRTKIPRPKSNSTLFKNEKLRLVLKYESLREQALKSGCPSAIPSKSKFCADNNIRRDSTFNGWHQHWFRGEYDPRFCVGESVSVATTKNNIKQKYNVLQNIRDQHAQLSPSESDKVFIDRSLAKNLRHQYGLFAKTDIQNGDLIGYYKGIIVANGDNSMSSSRYECKYNNLYKIDAADFLSCYARFINCSELSPNVKFVPDNTIDQTDTHKISTTGMRVIATKFISKGQELFIAYGLDYWIHDLKSKHKYDCTRNGSVKMLDEVEIREKKHALDEDDSDTQTSRDQEEEDSSYSENNSDTDTTPLLKKLPAPTTTTTTPRKKRQRTNGNVTGQVQNGGKCECLAGDTEYASDIDPTGYWFNDCNSTTV